ncbi:ABC transporter ATP-binding protein [Rhodovibrio sodomensis]|uniref:ABC transporter ATP-binding protein n=1 Tax=Rhodovibrio sodomensis TaxID=1088 RepID=A0ABS1DLR4_9PROT|nr:ABC transporter ATP-binding protein [Rhodovibrio sodomensis]
MSEETHSDPAARSGQPHLDVEAAAIDLDGRRLLGPISLSVPGGEVVTVMGPSGSGKSSLLAFLTGTLPHGFSAHGRVLIDGADVTAEPPEARRIGILFQDDLLFPHLSVAENLAFGLPPGLGRRQRRQRVYAALKEAELDGFGDRDPATLSGGQRARVALLRTLLAEPRALLLDEPFSKLDAALRGRLRRFVFEHARARGLPILLVTHDPDDAQAAQGPILELGRTADSGPQLVSRGDPGG